MPWGILLFNFLQMPKTFTYILVGFLIGLAFMIIYQTQIAKSFDKDLSLIYASYPELNTTDNILTYSRDLINPERRTYAFIKDVCSGMHCYTAYCIDIENGKLGNNRATLSQSTPDNEWAIDFKSCTVSVFRDY